MKIQSLFTATLSALLLATTMNASADSSNPFTVFSTQSAQILIVQTDAAKCGAEKKATDAKCGAAKCGAEKKATDAKCGAAKCGAEKKAADAKCGAAKCGASK
ncbi:hypothetical protein THMIRHAS_15700 [Thiosulfatimonas sediminis]|uniref:Low-complexity protein n=1 Tax=Thiosulfatimonas sediminis TaxID=2675054 RepID=A0A6F8PVY0_9GAMM|nr:low-complexity protein [Thiosulfatimonas sediminis]BBP46197.1 hypothetical protein THMIRHAS_15700 [Thiosulfatimonas sediminis]